MSREAPALPAGAPAPATAPTPRTAPGPRGHWLLGSLLDAQRGRHEFFLAAAREFGEIVRFRMGSQVVHLLSDPAHLKHVLQDNQHNYTKETRSYFQLRSTLGEGLLTTEGEVWRRQRRLTQPAFHRSRLARLDRIVAVAAAETHARWEAAGERPVDLSREMMRLSLRIVGEELLGADMRAEADAVGDALGEVLRYTADGVVTPWQLPERVPTPGNRRYVAARATLDRIVHAAIDDRRRRPGARDDLLSLLMAARDEGDGTLSDRELRDQVMTFFVAGHETTANALGWSWYCLSKAPPIRRKLEAEIDRALGGREPGFEDLAALRYATMVLEEAMRLYPPLWSISRRAVGDDVIGGFHVPAGSMVRLSSFVTHRNPRVWENPEGFDPDRFAPEAAAARPRYAYFPFGGGQRHCIGSDFALVAATLALATLASRWRIDLVPGHPVVPEATITLRPRDGLRATVHRR